MIEINPQRSFRVPASLFFGVILVLCIGWIIALRLMETPQGKTIDDELIEIAKELLRVVIVAGVAGIVVERWVHSAEEDPYESLRQIGIKKFFPRRQDAREEFLRCVRDPSVHSLTICGVSLRDFLINGGTFDDVWRELCERLRREQASNMDDHLRLRARLLLLLPNSDEGYFRYAVETQSSSEMSGLPFDIPRGLNRVRLTQQEIFGDAHTPYLQVRVYEHCPFSFIFATEGEMFVEQYDYRDQSQAAAMPLMNYAGESSQFKEQNFSLETIWENGRPADLIDEVGTAAAIREARVKNIFRSEQRVPMTQKQIRIVANNTGQKIDILAISGKFYATNAHIARELQRISGPVKLASGDVGPGVPIRFAIINPVSQQAILRAVADESPPEEIGRALQSWDWTSHQNSSLFRDTRDTGRMVMTWRMQRWCNVSVRVYSSSVACMIFRTERHAFVEQYMYGRSKIFQPGFNLGGEYPVIEYDLSKDDDDHLIEHVVEHEVIAATFDIVWDYYSIPWGNYIACDERQEFELNLARLRSELGM